MIINDRRNIINGFVEICQNESDCKGLTEKEAKWVVAISISQLSIKELAEREKVSVSAVKQWKSGAIRKLKKNHNQ
nr:sigma factor-like helix-turn-helix DNA-binding protein [Neobacillus sp. 179.-C4.2 HS]